MILRATRIPTSLDKPAEVDMYTDVELVKSIMSLNVPELMYRVVFH